MKDNFVETSGVRKKMSETKKKRTVLDLQQKYDAVKRLDRGIPAYKIAEELGVGKTQIQNLRKRKHEVIQDFENNVPVNTKRRRHITGNEQINDLTLAWFRDAVCRRIIVTGPLLKTKALQFATDLNNSDFKASHGWLESFIKRNNISFGSMSGERGDVQPSTVCGWKARLPELCEGYTADNIFNMDETGLFFRDTSRKTFHFKGDDCSGGKRSKERITVALCSSATGENIKPLVIGKSNNPRCFKNIRKDSLPVDYYYNKKAWMNSKIYEEFLKRLNRKMRVQKRNILLFVDNAPSHPNVELSNVKVQFLPPNTTSLTQPMDQGIIHATKHKLRRRQLLHIVKEMDRQPTIGGTDLLKQISILDAIYWLSNSWKEVTDITIQKCFQKAGFVVNDSFEKDKNESASINDDQIDSSEQLGDEQNGCDNDDDVPLAALKMSYEIFGCSFNDLLEIDSQLYTCDTETINWDKPVCDILDQINEEDSGESDNEAEENSDIQETIVYDVPSLTQTHDMVFKLKSFALQHGHAQMMHHLSKLDEEFSRIVADKSKQTKIIDFFNRAT